jgi:DNA-binding LacI/PurR family transcriptional regulator
MTVSRVVRRTHAVQPSTEAAVRKALARLDYRPDPALSALAAYRMKGKGRRDGSVLAFLDCDGTPFSREVLAGAAREALTYGYRVEPHALPRSPKAQERLQRQLFQRGIRGLLFGPSDDEWDFAGWNWPEFAAVSLGALAHRPAMHAVASDYFQAAYSGVRLLRERGASRIGLAIDRRLEARTGHRWLGGYAAALGGERLLVSPGNTASFRRWCLDQKVDALVTIHGGLLEAWPGEPSRLVLLNSTDRGYLRRLTFLSLDPANIGEEGVRFLHHLLLQQEYGLPAQSRTVSLKGTWIVPA